MAMKMSKKKKRVGLIVILTLVAAIGFAAVKTIWLKPFSINQFYSRALIKCALKDPQLMTSLSLLDSYGLDYYNRKLTDPLYSSVERRYAMFEGELEVLRSYDRNSQTEEELMSTDILDWYLQNVIEGKDFMYNGCPVNQFLGVQKELPKFMVNSHTILSMDDAKDYIARLNGFGKYFDSIISNLKTSEAKGIIPPSFVVRSTIQDMEVFLDLPVKSNSLYRNFEEKVSALKLPDGTVRELCAKAEEAVREVVFPAYQKLIAYYKDLLPRTSDYVGVWSQANGDAYYAYIVRSLTTLDISPEELYRKLEFRLGELQDQLKNNTSQSSAKNGRAAYPLRSLADCQKVVDDMTASLGKLVNTVPETKVVVRFSVSNGAADSGICQYFSANIGSSEPATINIPTAFTGYNRFLALETLFHEGVPGHHLQLSIAREMENVPIFRKVIPFSSFIEGWANYAQYLPWEYGLISDTDRQKEIISAELYYIGRAMIDIGINCRRWTREEARAFAVKNQICNAAGADALIDYCTVCPGSELSYAVGSLEIRELRDYAQSLLGDNFDIREFHDEVLKNGAIPLDILDKNIKEYVARKLGA